MVGNAESIINMRLAPALSKSELELAQKHWDEIVIALGEVAAGVAHEIRNPLTGIKGFSQLLQNSFNPKDKEWPYIKNILRETEKIETLIEELLMLSRPTFPRKRWLKVGTLFDEVLPILAREAVSQRVRIETCYEDIQEYVKVDINQLRVVLFQLGKHSILSMDEGQLLQIEVGFDREQGFCEISFTRPVQGKKEGFVNLGTAVVQKIIENHHGVLRTKCMQDGRHRITIIIPITDEEDMSVELKNRHEE